MFSLFNRAKLILEYGETTNGVGKVEWAPVFMTVIDRKGLDIASLC